MLEVTILKVAHSGEHEARKTLSYIKECDVLGTESGFATEATSSRHEADWEYALSSGMSRSALRKWLPRHILTDSYGQKIFDYAFRERKPVWFAERFPEGTKKIKTPDHELFLDAASNFVTAHKCSEEELFSSVRAHFKNYYESLILPRDKHIAKQLGVAEERIRERYPVLATNDTIRYMVLLGAGHKPENYTEIPTQIVNLMGDDITAIMTYAGLDFIRHQKPFEDEFKRDFLAFMYLKIMVPAKMGNLNEQELRNTTYQDLLEIVKQTCAKYEVERKSEGMRIKAT